MNEEKNPFAAQAEEVDQYCWRDSSRVCNTECVSYDDRCEADPVWSPCILINIQRAQAKSHANIATELKRQNDLSESEAQRQIGREGQLQKKAEAEAYAKKVQEMDQPPPKVTT
jgi:hypothetical protein